MNPVEFEKQVARILDALNGRDSEVIWNDRIPDPDNPSQSRQVDISIRQDSRLTIVECRLHNRKQDVKWIEELFGRKISLNAESVIGVSSSGFTKGAVQKARRLGVFLRGLAELTDGEIASWGSRTKAIVSYIKFEKIRLCIVADDLTVFPMHVGMDSLRSKDDRTHPVGHALNSCINRLCEIEAPEGPFTMQIFFNDTSLAGIPVVEAVLQATWRWIRSEVILPIVLSYQNRVELDEPAVLVEKNMTSRSEVHHRPNGAFANIDVSGAVPENCCFLRDVKVLPGKDVAVTSIGLVGIGESGPGLCDVVLVFVLRSSSGYRSFLNQLR